MTGVPGLPGPIACPPRPSRIHRFGLPDQGRSPDAARDTSPSRHNGGRRGGGALPVRLGSVLGLSFGGRSEGPREVFPDDSFPGERCDRGAGPPKKRTRPESFPTPRRRTDLDRCPPGPGGTGTAVQERCYPGAERAAAPHTRTAFGSSSGSSAQERLGRFLFPGPAGSSSRRHTAPGAGRPPTEPDNPGPAPRDRVVPPGFQTPRIGPLGGPTMAGSKGWAPGAFPPASQPSRRARPLRAGPSPAPRTLLKKLTLPFSAFRL